MRTLYKYSGDLGANFIDNPTIKLSIPSKLNDPFENNLSADFNKYIIKCLNNINDEFTENALYLAGIVLKFIGIISLSETHRNSLMWAHYAAEHTGMCLGIDSDFLSNKKDISLPLIKNDMGITGRYIPEKVNYDNARFDIDAHEIISMEDFESARGYQELIFKQLSLKSDEWIYEKEHRAIVPINYADEVLIKRHMCPERITKFISMGQHDGNIESLGNYRYKLLTENIFKLLCIIYENCEKDRISFLCKIPPKSINCIYLGVNYNEGNKLKIIEKLKNSKHPLKHIKVFQKSINNERFEFNSNLIYSPEN